MALSGEDVTKWATETLGNSPASAGNAIGEIILVAENIGNSAPRFEAAEFMVTESLYGTHGKVVEPIRDVLVRTALLLGRACLEDDMYGFRNTEPGDGVAYATIAAVDHALEELAAAVATWKATLESRPPLSQGGLV